MNDTPNLKEIVQSPAMLALGILSYVGLVEAFGSFPLLSLTASRAAEAFDWQIFSITGGAWSYASLDIASATTIGTPILLLGLAVFYGVKTFRARAGRHGRFLSLISVTLATCFLAMLAIGEVMI